MSSNSAAVKDLVDGLPKQFVSSLRILFDILDETRTGFIRLRDIESRWSDDGVRGLPPGVIDGLRKVTPPNGFLSFERFVAGLKLVLTKKRDDIDTRRSFTSKENRTPLQEYNLVDRTTHSRDVNNSNKVINDVRHADKPHSIGSKDYDNLHQHRNQRPQYLSHSNTSKLAEHRHHSDSHFDVQYHEGRRSPPVQTSKSGSLARDISQSAYVIKPEVSNYPSVVGSHHPPPNSAGMFRQGTSNNQMPNDRDRGSAIPPRPDRPKMTSYTMKKSLSGPNLPSQSNSPPAVPPRGKHQSTWALGDLKNWQRDWTVKQNVDKYDQEKLSHPYRSSNKDNEIYANIEQFQRRSEGDLKKQPVPGPQKATVQRHGSGRRHTLANGIDQNMMKRMKQLEEETSVLRSGLAMVESARDWYTKQLTSVSDKQAMLGKVTYNDNSVEAHQERMNFQRARITEVNQHLRTLFDSSEKGFPIHMNLAVSSSANKSADNISIQQLKEQNRQLIEEVGQKKDQISQLEMEKSSLVRDLFEVRSKNSSGHDDTTFM